MSLRVAAIGFMLLAAAGVVVLVLVMSALVRKAIGKPPPGGNPIDRSPVVRMVKKLLDGNRRD